jgi:D-sedoheptulose 7-phosphate isomerase
MSVSPRDVIADYASQLASIISSLPSDQIAQFTDIIEQAHRNGRSIYIFGNGGSAATASHAAVDLAKGLECQPRLKALSLTDNVPLITAWANDTEYENIFAEQLGNFIGPGDVAIGISASGNSKNVLRAIELANSVGAMTIGLAGYDGGKLKTLAQHCLVVPSDNMQQIEDAHLVICHQIFTALRSRLSQSAGRPPGQGARGPA